MQKRTLGASNKIRLGLFGANITGMDLCNNPERWSASWSDNLAVARIADDTGLDFLLPVARWKGYGGASNPHGFSFETLTWAAGLLAATKKINVFSTVHLPVVHPVFAAKQMATLDHIGAGRFGLNVVCGWNTDELAMFGAIVDKDRRYDYAAEWLDIVKKIWSAAEEFDYKGSFFEIKGVFGSPKSWGGSQPILINAGQSPVGISFASRNCDILFSNPPRNDMSQWVPQIKHVREASAGAPIDIFTQSVIVCRPTDAEAQDYYRYCIENLDESALEKWLALRQAAGHKITAVGRAEVRVEASKSYFPYMIGSPETVAGMIRDVHGAGVSGIAMVFNNQLEEYPYFAENVLPILKTMKLRSA